MVWQVVLTDRAESDVDSVLSWFRDQHADAASHAWFAQLSAKLRSLEVHPERCAVIPESDHVGADIRELLFGGRQIKYRILYVINEPVVTVLRIWHSSRDAITGDDLT